MNPIPDYPRAVELKDGTSLTLRTMSRADETALLDFFRRIPSGERFFLKDDVVSGAVLRTWIDEIDFERAIPLLAIVEHRVVGDAALLRHHSQSLKHLAEVRVVVDPDYRNRGLASIMIEQLREIAKGLGLEELVFELVPGIQDQAIEAAEALGANRVGELPGWVRDEAGEPRTLLFLKLAV